MPKRLKNPKIKWVSLCPSGANKLPVVFKEDGSFELEMVSKMAAEGWLTALVYAPNLVDSQGDFADPETIKEMAYSFQKEGGQLDVRHNGQALDRDQAWIAETFIVQKGDPRFEGFQTHSGEKIDPTGSWGMVIKIEDPNLRKLYSEGKWHGVSLAGEAEREDAGPGWFRRMFSKPKESNKMEKEDRDLLKSLQDGLSAAQKQGESLAKAVEFLVKARQDDLVDRAKAEAEAKKVALDKEKADLKERAEKAEKELAELKKAKGISNQSPQDPSGNPPLTKAFCGILLNKEEADEMAEADKIVAALFGKKEGK
jgi:hypothetical protein